MDAEHVSRSLRRGNKNKKSQQVHTRNGGTPPGVTKHKMYPNDCIKVYNQERATEIILTLRHLIAPD